MEIPVCAASAATAPMKTGNWPNFTAIRAAMKNVLSPNSVMKVRETEVTTPTKIHCGQLLGLLNEIDANYPESRHSFATFVDKPLLNFGYPYQGSWYQGDWCLNVTTTLAFEGSNDDAVDILVSGGPGGGNDWAENQLGAMHDVAKGNLVEWSDADVTPAGRSIKRLLVVSTDSNYHIAGDGKESKHELVPNDGDEHTVCDKEDYPTIQQVKQALQDRNLYVVFLIGNTTKEDLFGVYTELLDSLDVEGGVYTINADGSNLLEIMEEAISDMEDDICDASIDVMFSQDVTTSYTNDMPNFKFGMESFIDEVNDKYQSPRYALSSFGDKPISPFGHAGSGDYCVRIDKDFTSNGVEVVNAVDNLTVVSGLDWRESQLDAMITSVLSPDADWRTGDMWEGHQMVRVVILATDAGYHRVGDAADKGVSLAAHPGTAIDEDGCTRYQYPSVEQLAVALLSNDVHPVFVPTSDIDSIYRTLLKDLEDNYGVQGEV
eukprot:CAMPEP_0113854268 /NCGR_PEP_ID=MMETSP0372-20130328/7181_1 /TAXON_ID=340204 /ORGANISM="Lankesteria abbotti" /LENGTH=489 /DNA_ID=CAMNT_0000827329 /DNA_START=621 /DNA_END=2087 /DNA_ORIENTATION=- /assembly_acc=CAM_ASM_000359